LLSSSYISRSFRYLLDEVPNAQFGFSFRKLRSAYTGACCRILRTSDFTELDIGFVNNYVDLAAMTNFVGTSDGRVVRRYDQSTFNRNISNTLFVQRPWIAKAGVLNIKQGHLAASYEGGQCLQSYPAVTNVLRNINKGNLLSVCKFDAVPLTTQSLLFISTSVDAGTTRAAFFPGLTSSKWVSGGRRLDANSFQSATSANNIDTNKHVLSAFFDYQNACLYQYVDGVLDGQNLSFQTAGSTSDTINQNITEGAIAPLFLPIVNQVTGHIYESVAWHSADLTLANIITKDYYGIE
jgi:hypothetical protein